MGSWVHNPNLVKLCCHYLKKKVQIRSQFCTCHESSAVVAYAKLWPDLIIEIMKIEKIIIRRFQLWAQKPSGKRVPVPSRCGPHHRFQDWIEWQCVALLEIHPKSIDTKSRLSRTVYHYFSFFRRLIRLKFCEGIPLPRDHHVLYKSFWTAQVCDERRRIREIWVQTNFPHWNDSNAKNEPTSTKTYPRYEWDGDTRF